MKREEFLNFIKDFRKNSENFENNNLGTFLEAIERYSEDIDGYYSNTKQNIDLDKVDWKVFSDILKGASIYE